ncbi:tetratricopeptide repeat protein [Armatimonas sp.]|uniref:AfsR/SARP family transcriptional regulator n=1 Tax=Armatimonas sp. TaxID=1872638 RepID=UPI00286A1EEA|nr:tetratricopeptide repeat protein [Armatimonas sp.]
MLSVRLFGPITIEVNGEPLPTLRSRRGLYLLALLTLRANREVARLWLAGTLWPDSDESQGLENLKRSLTDLRKALGPAAELLQSPSKHTLTFRLTSGQADVLAFDEAIQQDAPEALERVISLYRAPLLEDCYELWVQAEQATRRENYLAAVERLAARKQAVGELAQLVPILREAVARDPLREGLSRLLMTALTEAGSPAAAAEVYRELRSNLLREHNAQPSAELTALYNQIRAGATLAITPPRPPAPTSRKAPAHYTLPRPLTALVGRENELLAVAQCLQNACLVTLTGPGGIGKTRLALETARSPQTVPADGACFVDLAPLHDPTHLPQAMAVALGLQETGELPMVEALSAFLRPRSLLLVLDNCEHLLDASAELAGRLLKDCPNLQILTTSRQPLGITGEVVWRVPALEVPSRLGAPEELVERYSALRLFFERARAVQPKLRLTELTVQAAIEICRHLDGIALAIELAAARVKSLSVEQIAIRLDDRFRLLTGGSRDALPRQQTLRALIDWSYDLLPPAEQTLLARLALFREGFSLEAAEVICADGVVLEPSAILDILEQLVDKSLVVKGGSRESATPRYQMLGTIREYSRQKQTEEELPSLIERYGDWYNALALDADTNLLGPEQTQWLGVLDTEHNNFRQALVLRVGEPHLELCASLCRYWFLRGHWSEGREYLAAALTRTDTLPGTATRARALMGAGNLARNQGDFAVAITYFEECLALRRTLGDQRGSASILNNLATVFLDQSDYERAQSLYEESLTLCRELGETAGISRALHNLGMIANEQGDNEHALELYTESLALSRSLGNRYLEANDLHNLGNVAVDQGDYQKARSLLEESLSICRDLKMDVAVTVSLIDLGRIELALGGYSAAESLLEESLTLNQSLGDPRGVAASLNNLGFVALAQGASEQARQRLIQSLQHGHRRCTVDSFIGLAHLALREGQPRKAAQLYGVADRLRTDLKGVLAFLEQRIHDDDRELLAEQLGPAFAQEYSAGRSLSDQDAYLLISG